MRGNLLGRKAKWTWCVASSILQPLILSSSVGLGGLCSIFHPLCYSNMLEIIPIMLETMPQICLLCSNYAHNFWKEQMLFVFRNLNRPRANPLSITWASWGSIVGRRPPQAAGPAPGMHGPSWGIVGRNMYFCTVMYRSLSLDSGLPVPVYHVHGHYAQKYLLFPQKMLNAFWYLLCSKFCQHNPPRPTHQLWRTRSIDRSAYCACLLRMFTVSYKKTSVLRDPFQAVSTICITMKFTKLFVHALLAVAFVQTELALVQGEHEETGKPRGIPCFSG